jgi:integrase
MVATVFRRKGRKGGIYKWTGSTKRSFDTARTKAGIKDFRFHDIRHTYVTRKRNEGVPDRTIMAITGHRTMAVFMRYDSGPGIDQLKAAIDGTYGN